MKSILRNYLLNIIVIVFFTGLALWFTLKDNAAEVFRVLQHVDFWYLVLVLGCVLLSHLMLGWILQQYAHFVHKGYTLKEGFVNALVASFFHGITPSASGGQIAQAFVFHKQGIVVEKSASILVIDFIVYQIALVLVSFVLMVLKMPYFMRYSIFYLAIFGFVINTAVIVILILCTFSTKVCTWITYFVINLMGRLHLLKDKEKTLDGMKAKLEQFAEGLHILRKNQVLLVKVLSMNVLRLLLNFSIPVLCCLALHVPIRIEDVLTMIALTSFVSSINAFIPIPGASGGAESVFVIMFGKLLTSVQASGVMVLWRFATYHFVLILGSIVFVRVQNSKTKKMVEEV